MFTLNKSILLILFLLPFSTFSQQTTDNQASKAAFISDALFVYLHSGPSNQYRIVGTINAGQSVTYLKQDAETGYAQIQYEDGKTAWLPKEYVTFTPGLVSQLEQLKADYANHDETVSTLQQQRNDLSAELNTAITERNAALEQLEQTQQTYTLLKDRLDATQTSVWQKPMVLGSLILVVGLVFGLLLPIIVPKRRNKDRWM
jgi:SH3 domain protein